MKLAVSPFRTAQNSSFDAVRPLPALSAHPHKQPRHTEQYNEVEGTEKPRQQKICHVPTCAEQVM